MKYRRYTKTNELIKPITDGILPDVNNVPIKECEYIAHENCGGIIESVKSGLVCNKCGKIIIKAGSIGVYKKLDD